ncbi:Minichromosome maintenance domain-containing protein 2 [Pseudolycoriella hygida]|uniref:Minichromosome maintenance domain-containing protein 2 n=1 Tax=Pseudolycoriella hygida TaxID=35572 RepID=A0A9Q0NAA9_9DIPT|nr:Minichromosome maintenance domain-containing protein 2 [Pseudolycoriella hygida]
MYTRIFTPKEDDNLDEIFNLDAFDNQHAPNKRRTVNNKQSSPNNMKAGITIEAACQTPNIDLENSSVIIDNIISTDSAVGTEHSADLFSCMMNDNDHEISVASFHLPQDEIFSPLFSNVSDDHSPKSSFPFFTSDTSLADHSFHSLMNRSLVEDLPSTSTQLEMMTQNNETFGDDGDKLNTQHGTWSGYLTPRAFTQYEQKSQQHSQSIPQSILDLHTQVMCSGLSDWSFVYALSAQICQEFMPMSYNESDDVPIPIIAFGHDSSSANAIMSYTGNFAQRFLAPTDHFFNVTINHDKLVEVGPVFLAKNGVCFLGDWSALPHKFAEEIKTLTDSGRYFLNETEENFPLCSAVWTYWSSMERNKNDFVNIAMFMKYFGIPIEIDSRESDDIMEYLLVEAINKTVDIPNDVLNIHYEDMKRYLNTVRKIKVRKTEEAQALLQLYSKSIQADRRGLLSARSFQIIQQMADSFAKLSMRDKVLPLDVVSAIAIAEKTFYAITGIARAPLLSSTQNIEKVEQYIQVLYRWVVDYANKSKSQ